MRQCVSRLPVLFVTLALASTACHVDGPGDGGAAATGGGSPSSGCKTDGDCASTLQFAAPVPAGCAVARCVTAIGVCELSTRDDDGDGERASQCTGMLPIVTGTDCDDRPGAGAAFNAAAAEQCDGDARDENCNGTVDEGCACAEVGATLACCSGRGTQQCEARDGGGSVRTACSAVASRELCNGLDDDCNEAVDDRADLTPDGGVVALDAGAVLLDGGCVVGVGACARAGVGRCVAGQVGCSVEAAAPTDEVCNALDDDCDGETDEAGPTLCAVQGQLCTAGSCACPSGQSVCGAACAGVGSTCSAGVGACARPGNVECNAGSASCTAVAGAPGTEVCNGSDDDCDGQTDEGVTIACLTDADNDQYASTNVTSQQCPDPARTPFGNCPVGYVSPAASLGIDCSPMSAALFRNVALYPDADNDGYCTGGAVMTCIGASIPSGQRATCTATTDCAPADATRWVTGAVGVDSDGDRWCTTTSTQCYGSTYPAGYRSLASCLAMTDCAGSDASRWQTVTGGVDADDDRRCTGTSSVCAGSSWPAGYREPSTCLAMSDCSPGNGGAWQQVNVYRDGDNDGFCLPTPLSQCLGDSAPSGYRFVNQCVALNDCRDTNPHASTVCSLDNEYFTYWITKSCGIGIPQCEQRAATNVERGCPLGWHPTGFFASAFTPAECTLVNPGTVNLCCAGVVFGTAQCRVYADCVPD
ncbi:MAG: hypothetical protein JNK82_35595 [Myxococcaceae bacterium]|nr:hypothetical protein [Myxococcaceae bacterium]